MKKSNGMKIAPSKNKKAGHTSRNVVGHALPLNTSGAIMPHGYEARKTKRYGKGGLTGFESK